MMKMIIMMIANAMVASGSGGGGDVICLSRTRREGEARFALHVHKSS